MKARKSWLRDVKTVFDLGDDMNTLPSGHPDWDKRDKLYMERVLQAAPEPAVAEEYKRFFGYRMHDARVLGISRSDRELRIRLHDLNAVNFVYAVSEFLELPMPECVLPVELTLLRPQYVRGAAVDQKGRLLYSDWKNVNSPDPSLAGFDYISDTTHREGDLLLYIGNICEWKMNGFSYLLVECRDAKAIDRRADAIAKAFTPDVAQLWRQIWAEEPYPYGHEYEYVERSISEQNLDVAKLLPRRT